MSDTNFSSPSASTPASPASPTSAPSGTSSTELAELREMCAELRWQTHTLRIALLVVATSLCGFFWLESRRNGQALQMLRPQAAQVVEMTKAQKPAEEKFIGQLVEYARTHPDFVNVLKKYPIMVTSNVVPAAATSPAPAGATPPATR